MFVDVGVFLILKCWHAASRRFTIPGLINIYLNCNKIYTPQNRNVNHSKPEPFIPTHMPKTIKNNSSLKGPQQYFGSLISQYTERRKIKIIPENCTPITYYTSRNTKLYTLATKFLMCTFFRKVRIGRDKAHVLHIPMSMLV